MWALLGIRMHCWGGLVNCYVVAKVFRVFMQLLGGSLLTQVPPIVSMIFISYNMSLYEILYVLLFVLLFELFVLLLARWKWQVWNVIHLSSTAVLFEVSFMAIWWINNHFWVNCPFKCEYWNSRCWKKSIYSHIRSYVIHTIRNVKQKDICVCGWEQCVLRRKLIVI